MPQDDNSSYTIPNLPAKFIKYLARNSLLLWEDFSKGPVEHLHQGVEHKSFSPGYEVQQNKHPVKTVLCSTTHNNNFSTTFYLITANRLVKIPSPLKQTWPESCTAEQPLFVQIWVFEFHVIDSQYKLATIWQVRRHGFHISRKHLQNTFVTNMYGRLYRREDLLGVDGQQCPIPLVGLLHLHKNKVKIKISTSHNFLLMSKWRWTKLCLYLTTEQEKRSFDHKTT